MGQHGTESTIPESWMRTLEAFLGIDYSEIKKLFYKQPPTVANLFGELISRDEIKKEVDTVNAGTRFPKN